MHESLTLEQLAPGTRIVYHQATRVAGQGWQFQDRPGTVRRLFASQWRQVSIVLDDDPRPRTVTRGCLKLLTDK